MDLSPRSRHYNGFKDSALSVGYGALVKTTETDFAFINFIILRIFHKFLLCNSILKCKLNKSITKILTTIGDLLLIKPTRILKKMYI